MKKCELCNSFARMYCDSDQASLCWDCDARVHMANFLVAKHWRTLLCHVCQSPTPWTASGPRLAPVVSFCPRCDNSTITTSAVTEDHQSGNDRGDDDDDDEDDEADQSDRDDNEDDDDGENQVVPLASTPVPPVASSSSSREESSKRFSQRRFDAASSSASTSNSASRVAVLSNRADQNSTISLCDRMGRSQKKPDYKIR